MGTRLLVTGGCGFVGSNLSLLFKEHYPEWEIVAFDNLKRRGSELNISRLKERGILFIHGDVRNKEDFDEVGKVDYVIDAAAEPSVLAGLSGGADYLLNTNLQGTLNCANYALKYGALLLFLSTSRVYPFKSLDDVLYSEGGERFSWEGDSVGVGVSAKGISENFPLVGARSLYGASKLASELLVLEYSEFMGLRSVINRCGVLTGPWQMGKVDQGVIVLWMARHFWNGRLTYNGYGGSGKQVRDILHIHDLFALLLKQMDHTNHNAPIYNVGGGLGTSISLRELTGHCELITGNKIPITSIEETRKADVRVYYTDNSFVHETFDWFPSKGVVVILQEIFDWIKINQHQLYPILK